MQLRRILCGVDLSDASTDVLREAARQARLHGAALTLLHVLPDSFPGVPMSPEGSHEQLLERERLGREIGDALADRLARVAGADAPDATIEVEDGAPALAIVARAEAVGADLIVVGGGHRHLLGSVAEKVVREARGPVLVARPGHETRTILVAIDFSPAAEAALAFAADQARRRGAELVLVHCLEVIPPPVVLGDPAVAPGAMLTPEVTAQLRQGAEERLQRILELQRLPGRVAVVEEPPTTALPRLAAETQATLVAVGAEGHTRLRRLLLGSVAEAVVRRAPCSVLAARHPGER